MMRPLNIYTICLLFGVSIILIIDIHIRRTDNTFLITIKSQKNDKIIIKVENGEESYTQQKSTILRDNTHNILIKTETRPVTKDENYSYGSPDIKTKATDLQDETNSSTDITNILDKTRSKIKYDYSDYNFSLSGGHKLEDFVMESGGQPLRSLIISTWRSGSNFLGDLVNNAVPSTYYNCEPLLMYGAKRFRTPIEASETLRIIKQIFKCNYDNLEDYFEFERNNLYGFSHKDKQWEYCKNENEVDMCYNAEVTSRLCQLFPFQNIKLVRLRLKLVEEILDDKELNVKVILLIRDPRGVMQSRRDENFCKQSSDCWDPSMLCADMVSDYMAAGKLLQQYPDRLMVLRFEELALQPNIISGQILNFLKVARTQAFDEFLHSHTNLEVAGIYATSRVSRNIPYKWKTTLDFNYVNEIQMDCKEAMRLWGYKMAHNETHMTSKDFNPADDYTNFSE